MGQWGPAWRDLRVPAAVVLLQVLWWPLRPWWFGAGPDARPLASCNYDCPYCPFAKRRDPPERLRADRAAL
ncbi:hypothetical protein AB0M46_50690, partial [Dactylosporangium sp. NPDC051485]